MSNRHDTAGGAGIADTAISTPPQKPLRAVAITSTVLALSALSASSEKPDTQLPAAHHLPQPLPKTDPPVKYKMVRDYSGGSIADQIARAETAEDLDAMRLAVVKLMKDNKLSKRALRKIEAAGSAKAREIMGRLIVRPSANRLVVPPSGIEAPGRIIMP